MNPDILLSRLLDKYEKSTHLLHPGSSTRRVMLRIGKKEFPEYNYEDAQIRDAWNDAVRALEARGLVSAEWVKGRPVLSAVVLNLDHVMDCYRAIGRIHPVQWAKSVADLARSQLGTVTTEWIAAWRDDVCTQAREAARVPSYCKKDLTQFRQLLTAFAAYDALHGEAITMRAFSGKCYQNTKTFELEVRDLFLKIASAYYPELAEACEHEALGERDRLAFLGIYARPELYELAGNCIIRTDFGNIDLASAGPYGLALPSTAVDCIRAADLHRIRTVILIENKTNYDAFLLTEREQHDLVLYHGGFLSPQKRKFFLKIAASVPSAVPVYLWADIDLGGCSGRV